MQYLRARYYDSGQGRFLSRDTWDGNEEQPITYNLWAYANANPVMYTDPTGKSAQQSLVPAMNNQTSDSMSLVLQYFDGEPCMQFDLGTLSDFWLGFWKEAYRVNIWFNPFPWVQQDVAIKNNESTPMLIGRLTADIVSIAAGGAELDTAGLLFAAGPAECVAGVLAAGVGELVTCPGAALQMAGAAILAGQAVVSGAIAVRDGAIIVSMLRGRNGGGGSGMFGSGGTQFTSKTFWTSKEGKVRLDAENPAPGQRPGNIHIQDKITGGKYYYNPSTGQFDGLPSDIERITSSDPSFQRALEQALRYLGER